uniref:Uncharacterized protein n=1 Tax=Nelumbo nucifera TaxID=4432 RepID=A0A822ZEX4_NELNU|nr:TPA_asm: hypothetical protein HUJ06_000532 [Nelumbo nucifera]
MVLPWFGVCYGNLCISEPLFDGFALVLSCAVEGVNIIDCIISVR